MTITQDYASTGWLQAFMGAQDALLQQSRLSTKKHIDWIDALCSLTTIREKRDSLDDCLTGLWDYAQANELGWLVKNVPASQTDWVLPTTDDFTIECRTPPIISDAKTLGCALGIYDWTTKVMLRIQRSEFATWQRRVARNGSGAPIGFTVATSEAHMMELDCSAIWTANDWVDGTWRFAIDGQPLMTTTVEEPIQVVRPDASKGIESMLFSIMQADSKLRNSKGNSGPTTSTIPAWIPAGDPLVPLHEGIYGGRNGLAVSRSFQSAWDAIWPVLYCRRKKLGRGHCEMKFIRSQLDQAIQTEPKLVTWIFVFGELLCQTYLSDGLGISAKYKV
jgi:hypothetical protein